MKHRSVLTLVTLLGLVGGFLSATVPASATVPGANGYLLFEHRPTGGPDEIRYSSDFPGGSEGYALFTPTNGYDPAWAPDGYHFAYSGFVPGGFDICLSTWPDGGCQTNLTNAPGNDEEPAWSPDGSKIAFVSDRDGNDEIYVMNANGTGQTRLTTDAATDFNPAWSPRGDKIAFETDRDGNREVYVMNANGTGQTDLTNNSSSDGAPSWSPDGSRIAFWSVRPGNQFDIWWMYADGTAPTRVTNDAYADFDPAWSPDGLRIAYATDRDTDNDPSTGIQDIHAVNLDGTVDFDITNSPTVQELDPDWQPVRVVVNSANDVDDGTCDATHCSLREAINAANFYGPGLGIVFNVPGLLPIHIAPSSPLPALSWQTVIDGTSQPGYAGQPVIWLDGGGAGPTADGLVMNGGPNFNGEPSVVRGLAISGWGGGAGIRVGGSTVVEGNFIGTDTSGSTVYPNFIGVLADGGGNTIGGTTIPSRNVISGNTQYGVDVDSSSGNRVIGNYIGLNAAANAKIANGVHGVQVFGATDTIVGTPSAPNVIEPAAGGTGIHLELGTANVVQGNRIGTDPTGTAIFGFGTSASGIHVDDTGGNTIGGTAAGAGNVIGGVQNGIVVSAPSASAAGTMIEGNLIGQGPGGEDVGNATDGIQLLAVDHVTVGGTSAGAGNVIGGNDGNGISILGGGSNTIQGNTIGVRGSGNSFNGVEMSGTDDNTVGGTAPGAGNTIAYNGGDGVLVRSNRGNAVRGNSIFSNGGLGINLAPNPVSPDGVTPNDPKDPDTGANNLQNFPIVTWATLAWGAMTVQASVDSAPSTTFTLDVYANDFCDGSGNGEGRTFIGSSTVTTGGGGTAEAVAKLASPDASGQFVTATLTDPNGNTSEFSPCNVAVRGLGTGATASGDFNNDGLADLAIGVPKEDVGTLKDAGAINVLYGSSAGLDSSGNQLFTQGPGSGLADAPEIRDYFGSALAAGDFNGDSFADLAVGVPGEDVGLPVNAGEIHVVYGSASGLTATGNQLFKQGTNGMLDSSELGDAFGATLAAGNFNGDAYVDLAVGVPGEDLSTGALDAGAVAVLYGSAAGLSTAGNQLWTQDSPGVPDDAESGDHFGAALAAANLGNGVQADLAVGVPEEDQVKCTLSFCTTLPEVGLVNVLYGTAGI